MEKGTALITGAAKRVGKAIALRLAAEGYNIALHYHHSRDEAQGVADEIRKIGVACHLYQANLANYDAVTKLAADVAAAHSDWCALVNNASVFERATLLETTEELFTRNFDTNFKAPFFLTQGFAVTQKDGCVINVLDTYITRDTGAYFAYLQSKKVLADFTKMAARELAPRIRVNGVCPGMMLPSNGVSDSYFAELPNKLPMQQTATPEQVATAVFLLIQQPGLTGNLLFVDGGQQLL